MTALAFLSALWPSGIPQDGRLVLSIKDNGRMRPEFHTTPESAAASALIAGATTDVYVGMAIQPQLERGRGTTATAIAIPGVWLDLDFDKGFRDMAGVEQFLSALPMQPSLMVFSGGGIHAHWLFQEQLLCAGGRAAGLELGWLRYCREVARIELKAELDAIADLARVLRVPGTRNFKRQPVVTVELRTVNDLRYSPDDFERWRVEQRASSGGSSTATFEFSLREDAQPPFEKWRLVYENVPDIVAVFEHRRKMPTDNSLSGYDLSLATRLDALDWSAQEIVDTLIAHRKRWMDTITDTNTLKDPLHLRNPSYYERVLRKARTGNTVESIKENAAAFAADVAAELDELAPGTAADKGQRARWFRGIYEQVGIEVVDLWAADRIEGDWNLRIRCVDELRDIKISSPDKLLVWQFWRSIIMYSGINVESFPKKEPPGLYALTSRAGVILRVLPRQGARQTDELIAYLSELAETAPQYEQANILEKQAFLRVDSGPRGLEAWGVPEECLFVRPDMMYFDIKNGRAPKIENLRQVLAGLGFVPRVVAARTEKSNTTRNYMAFPMSRLNTLQQEAGWKAQQEEESYYAEDGTLLQ